MSSRNFGVTERPRGTRASTLVVGLGNPILGDDGVGWRVVDALPPRLVDEPDADIDLDRVSVGGVALMEVLAGYRRAILVDAILAVDDPPGTVWCRDLREVVTSTASHLDSSHDATLPTALAAGRALGVTLPDEILVVGITIERGDLFGELLSAPVEAAVPGAVALIASRIASPARPSAAVGPT